MQDWSAPIVRVYEECTDEILINIAKHFPVDEEVSDTFAWQARKMAEMGQLTKENATIIAQKTGQTPEAVEKAISSAAYESLKTVDPQLAEAAKKGFLPEAQPIEVSARINNILTNYSAQAKNQLNLVNTVMLDSSKKAFQKVVTNTVVWQQQAMSLAEKQAAQQILNASTGSVATGISSHQAAVRKAVKQMADAGLTGFVDRGGHIWQPETYVAMDIRTTCGNVATQAVFARNEDYGNDLIWVRTKAEARPLCFPYQGKVLSKNNRSGTTEDLDGKKISFEPLSSTSYGEPAGLFGINCGHTPPNVFIPGFSKVRNAIDVDDPKVQAANEKAYALRQKQRALEREVRYAKRDAAIANATGDKELFTQTALKVKQAQAKLNGFNEANGLSNYVYRTQVAGYNSSVATKATAAVKKQSNDTLHKKYAAYLGTSSAAETAAKVQSIIAEGNGFLLDGYVKAVKKGDIHALVGIDTYISVAKEIETKLVGVTAANGVVIEKYTPHFVDRIIGQTSTPHKGMRQGVSMSDALQTIIAGSVKPVTTTKTGKTSQRIVGEKCSITINPAEKKLIQVNPKR